MFGTRLQQARRAAGLSLRDLAGKAGISAMALSKYERDMMTPAAASLEKLARALSVRTDFFYSPIKVAIEEPSFRRQGNVPHQEQEKIQFAIQESLERMLDLEHIFGVTRSTLFRLPAAVTREMAAIEESEARAEALRMHWNLGLAPLENVAGILEEQGVKVFIAETPKGIDGFSCRARGNWVNTREAPVIVCSREISGDRQRFSMLHELGHLALTAAVGINKEKACHRFASAFLVPGEAALRELGARRSRLSFSELKILKKKYGMSMQAWIYRALDLAIIGRTAGEQLLATMSHRGWRKKEPCEIAREEPRRYKLLLFQAVMEGLITKRQAREYLGRPGGRANHDLEPAVSFVSDEYATDWVFEELTELFQEECPDE
jgi:Zn-dependent peptidase ImmA (M78 family)/DNA-binding XRE family transcriptional regulator